MACTYTFTLLVLIFLYFTTLPGLNCDKDNSKSKEEKKPKDWKKKDVRDYSEADMERLFEQWEDADEPLPNDELPEWKREPPKIDISKIDTKDPEGVLKMTKKGKTLMLFASVSGDPSEAETEQITKIWQGSLFNANIETQRFAVGQNRVIFMVEDGALGWDVKNYLVKQDRCSEVTIDGKSYPGKGADPSSQNQANEKKSKDSGKKSQNSSKKSGSGKNKKSSKKDDNNRTDRKDEL